MGSDTLASFISLCLSVHCVSDKVETIPFVSFILPKLRMEGLPKKEKKKKNWSVTKKNEIFNMQFVELPFILTNAKFFL